MKKFLPEIKTVICLLLCAAVCIIFACMAFKTENKNVQAEESILHIWQIDGFEGGKGSRGDYLNKIGKEYAKTTNCFVSVTSISANAARMNIDEGNLPDLISYGAGMYGIESVISSFKTWCYGGYCILSLDETVDFSDINSDNVIINEGKDNFVSAVALLNDLSGAKSEKSTSAYVRLINGDYKYLLGTQRDIFRLKTRGVSFTVKPITQFNDLYQNISVTTSCKSAKRAQEFIDFLISNSDGVQNLGMLSEGKRFYDDEMKRLEGLEYEMRLTSPISLQMKTQIENAISNGEINNLKNLLK